MSGVHVVCPHCNTTNRVPAEKLTANGKCGQCKLPLFTGAPLELTQANFMKHIQNSDLPVVVDFWASWCGPCKMMAPHFDRAARELEPSVRLAKLNTEIEQSIAGAFNIRSIPTLIVFKQGREVARQSGAMDAANLMRWIKSEM